MIAQTITSPDDDSPMNIPTICADAKGEALNSQAGPAGNQPQQGSLNSSELTYSSDPKVASL
jgi:hypothetical protein